MSDTQPNNEPQSIALSLARHAVPIALLLGLYAIVAPRVGGVISQWAIGVAFVFGTSVVLAGLFTLYAKNRSRALLAVRVRNIAWVLVILLFVDPIMTRLKPSTVGHEPKEAAHAPVTSAPPTSQPAAPVASSIEVAINPDGAALLQQMRTKYPDLKGLSDEQAVRAIHEAFYADLPLPEVAAKLGMRLQK